MTWHARLPFAIVLATLVLLGAAIIFIPKEFFRRRPNQSSTQIPQRFEPDLVSGMVRDSEGPVVDAVVRFAGQSTTMRSDHAGRFTLPRPDSGPATLTAWKPGYFIGQAEVRGKSTTIELHRLPSDDNESYRWVSPSRDAKPDSFQCGNCHEAIYDEWAQGGHAKSFAGRRFQALFGEASPKQQTSDGWSLQLDRPDGTKVCSSCHSPTKRDIVFDEIEERAIRTDRELSGVHCDFCHKIAGAGGGKIGLAHGRFGLQALRPSSGQLIFGPFADSTRSENTFAAIQKSSRLCASCHEGVVFGVRVYETYSEWQASPAAKAGIQCQDCHMKATGRMTNVAPGHGGVERDPHSLANHTFFDGSHHDMLKRCLKLDLRVSRNAAFVQAKVGIAVDGVGHRVPTGLPDRNLTLSVEAFDANGKAIAATSGPKLPALAGSDFNGKAGKLFAKILKDWDGKSPVPFWRAAPEFVDTSPDAGAVAAFEL